MKGVLIADAGSTKTDWAYLEKESGNITAYKSKGLNPLQTSSADFQSILEEIHSDFLKNRQVTEIYFYGAGCATPQLKKSVSDHFHLNFPSANVEIESDLIGAARALFGDGSGIVCILGTGSNSCLWENGEIKERIPSLGFILGDEGSGSAIGKELINRIFKRDISQNIITKFNNEYSINVEDIIEKVYHGKNVSAFLASFAPFVIANLENDEMRDIARNQVKLFFDKNIVPYHDSNESNLGFIGSIACSLKDIIVSEANNRGFKAKEFIKAPLERLCEYHKEENYNEL